MKKINVIFILLFVVCCVYAQDPVNSILKNSSFKNIFNSNNVEQSIKQLSDIWKADGNGVSFVLIVDSLPLSSSEIISYSKKYLEDAYRPSKYEIENLNPDNLVIGKGAFNNFESYAAFPNQYTFNCVYHMRIDAKQGRARICFSLTEYDLIRINGNINENRIVKVKDVSPLNPDSDSRKMYNKAFLSMAKLAVSTLYDIREMLKSKSSTQAVDW